MKLNRTPVCYSASEIATWHVSEEYEPNKWRPARPCSLTGFNLMTRLRLCWFVFTGQCDVLRWGSSSGEWKNAHVNYKDITEKGFKRVAEYQPYADAALTSQPLLELVREMVKRLKENDCLCFGKNPSQIKKGYVCERCETLTKAAQLGF